MKLYWVNSRWILKNLLLMCSDNGMTINEITVSLQCHKAIICAWRLLLLLLLLVFRSWLLFDMMTLYILFLVEKNIALNQPCWESSESYDGACGRALDGNSDGEYFSNSCTHTNNENQAWWAVDLGKSYAISHIEVGNRDILRKHWFQIFWTFWTTIYFWQKYFLKKLLGRVFWGHIFYLIEVFHRRFILIRNRFHLYENLLLHSCGKVDGYFKGKAITVFLLNIAKAGQPYNVKCIIWYWVFLL